MKLDVESAFAYQFVSMEREEKETFILFNFELNTMELKLNTIRYNGREKTGTELLKIVVVEWGEMQKTHHMGTFLWENHI